jgi:hypothetical protein
MYIFESTHFIYLLITNPNRMKNIDFKAIAIMVVAVVGGVALWELGVKPMVSKKTASITAPAVVEEV